MTTISIAGGFGLLQAVPPIIPNRWNLDAWEYRPTGSGPHPVIVMANGLGCNKLLGLASYAEEFCKAGYACLVFDYRRWGASDGSRRNCIYVSEQQDDYRTVVKYARQQPEYDPQRVVIWGFSFSGTYTHSMALDSFTNSSPALNVAASMAQNPYCGRPLPPFQFNRRYISLYVLGLLDLLADFLHLPLYTYRPSLRLDVTKNPSDFPNQIAASIFFRAPLHHRPRDALHLIRNPILLTAAKGDRICPHAPIVQTSRLIPTAELVEVSGDHFDIFQGNADWEQAIGSQLAFLRKYVPV
ncbi:peptidase-S15 domain-containing protein [Favolaschia claudopus]|uniref:Peptidase-S15 domain-containing protein n=1 Tax=Favolaschia claudopus TaxID=2862362 RepID=A0AAW0DWR6_9AGAR